MAHKGQTDGRRRTRKSARRRKERRLDLSIASFSPLFPAPAIALSAETESELNGVGGGKAQEEKEDSAGMEVGEQR